MPGTLFVVATPIGNLEDLTFRALRTLREVDVIAAEDTRRTSKLLAHYEVRKPLVSLHEHNEHRQAPALVARLVAGQSIALVSDAGTPAISDPGTILVRLAREAGVAVTPVPGPSAVIAALSVSGVPATPFTFVGFPPASGRARDTWMESLHHLSGAIVFFEAPHRIRRTLDDTFPYLGNRHINVIREISKINENLVIWDNSAVATGEPPTIPIREQGEFVVVVGPALADEPVEMGAVEAIGLFDRLTRLAELSGDDALTAMSALTHVSGAKLSKILKKARISVKRQTEKPS